jgi:hypothetical protein
MSDGTSVQERTPSLPWLRVNERGELELSAPDEAVPDGPRKDAIEDGMPVEAEIDEEVGNKKWIVAKARLYRDGLLVTDTDCSSGHPTEGLRGQVLVVCVDDKGRAHWVSSVYQLPTVCSKLDFCPSRRTQVFQERFPNNPDGSNPIGELTRELHIYASSGGLGDFRRSIAEAIKFTTDMYEQVKPLLALLAL